MRVIVMGAGAVGGLLGARLLGGDHEVVLIGRLDDVVAIRSNGLRVEGRTEGVFEPSAFESLVHGMEADVVLLTVKSYDVRAASEEVGRHLPSQPPLLALQNGLGIEAAVREGLAAAGATATPERVVRGISTLPVTRLAPGHLRHAGDGEIVLGRPKDAVARRIVDRFEGLLRSGGIEVRRVDEIEREVWRKTIVNAAINPVTADHRIVNGQLARDPWRGQAERLLHEAAAVAAAEGFEFAPDELEADLWRIVRASAENRSSMLQDLERGHRTEIEAISGEILRRGEARGLSLPLTRRAYDRIRQSELSPPAAAQPS